MLLWFRSVLECEAVFLGQCYIQSLNFQISGSTELDLSRQIGDIGMLDCTVASQREDL